MLPVPHRLHSTPTKKSGLYSFVFLARVALSYPLDSIIFTPIILVEDVDGLIVSVSMSCHQKLPLSMVVRFPVAKCHALRNAIEREGEA